MLGFVPLVFQRGKRLSSDETVDAIPRLLKIRGSDAACRADELTVHHRLLHNDDQHYEHLLQLQQFDAPYRW